MEEIRGTSGKGDINKQSTERTPEGRPEIDKREGKEHSNAKPRYRLARTYGITLDKWQLDFLACKGDKILCCGRQVGKTVICAIDAGEYAINNPTTKPIVMIAPTERQAYALFIKTLNYLLQKYPKHVIIKGKDRPTKTRIKLKSGVEIYCLPVGKDGLGVRFLTIGRIYKDECSRIPELVHEAVDPALLTTGGDEIDLSTPFGAIGTFHEIWINKDSVYDSFTRFSVTSEKVMQERPICATWTQKQRDKALSKLAQAKSRWSTRRYAQEYLGEFVSDLFRWFDDKLIYECCVLKRRDHIIHDRVYYMGIDLARMGEDKGTFEIVENIDRENIQQVDNIVTEKKFTTETFDRIIELESKWSFKKIGIDAGSGSLGVGLLDFLLREVTVRRKVIALSNIKVMLNYEGDNRRVLLKEDMYDLLKTLMERGKVKLLDDNSIIASLQSIQYEYVMKEGQPTKLRIYGDDSHIVEGLMRAVYLANQKNINTFVDYI